MYRVDIYNRGPEGVRVFKQVRLTEAGSEELQKRMEASELPPLDQLFAGIEVQSDDEEKPQSGVAQTTGKKGSKTAK